MGGRSGRSGPEERHPLCVYLADWCIEAGTDQMDGVC